MEILYELTNPTDRKVHITNLPIGDINEDTLNALLGLMCIRMEQPENHEIIRYKRGTWVSVTDRILHAVFIMTSDFYTYTSDKKDIMEAVKSDREKRLKFLLERSNRYESDKDIEKLNEFLFKLSSLYTVSEPEYTSGDSLRLLTITLPVICIKDYIKLVDDNHYDDIMNSETEDLYDTYLTSMKFIHGQPDTSKNRLLNESMSEFIKQKIKEM